MTIVALIEIKVYNTMKTDSYSVQTTSSNVNTPFDLALFAE